MVEMTTKQDRLNKRLNELHAEVNEWLPAINRIAVALYDKGTGVLKTFINSTEGGSPLEHYQAQLDEVKSLKELADTHQPRIINDLSVLAKGKANHTQKIVERGYKSSLTQPIVHNGEFYGFIFFNASETDYFTPTAVHNLGVYAACDLQKRPPNRGKI